MKTQTLVRIKHPHGTSWHREPMKTVLFKMCKVVGAHYYKINFSAPNWFREYTWTRGQEDEFEQWMFDFLYNNLEARQAFMKWPSKRKKEIKEIVKEFTWNHGWKTYSG